MKGIFVLLFLFVGLKASFAQKLSEHFNETDYPYILYLPNDRILKSHPPVMVFLHGRSLSGTTLESVKRYGVIHEILNGRNFPAIIIAPQTPMGKTWYPSKIKEVIRHVQAQYVTDTNRVYVLGMSLGGYGTLDFVGTYPEMVAGAVAMCGGGNLKLAKNLSEVPLWIRHGDRDRIVPLSESQKIVNAIRKYSSKNLKFTIDKGLNHGQLERFFRGNEIYVWLFKQEK